MGKGKSSKKKAPAASRATPEPDIAREPFSPYVSDGIRYSGLETDGMKTFKCSLILPKDRQVTPEVKILPPQTVALYKDPMFHSQKSRKVAFPGATVLQLEVAGRNQMPEVLTVAGKCRFTNECLGEFGIMMRTNTEARRRGIPVNGSFDWPDVRSLLLCPICEHMAAPDNEYWMLFYPLLQLVPPATFGMRTAQRLACGCCMESLLQGIDCKSAKTGEKRTMMEFLDQELPHVSFLDGASNPIISDMTNTDLSAWKLYSLWDFSGAWEANENVRKESMQRLLGARNSWAPNPESPTGQEVMVVELGTTRNAKNNSKKEDAKKEVDSKCCTCSKVMLPDDIMRCARCKTTAYCSKACQKQDWKAHKLQCVPSP